MNMVSRMDGTALPNWQSLNSSKNGAGYRIREADGFFRHSERNEAVVRFVGIIIVMGTFVQWTFPNANALGDPMLTKVLLAVAFSLIGLAVYSFATRGHRCEVLYDPGHSEIHIYHLSRRDEPKSAMKLSLNDVKSIYVKRPETTGTPAELRVRLKNSIREICVIRGDNEEIESLHRHLCRDIRLAESA